MARMAALHTASLTSNRDVDTGFTSYAKASKLREPRPAMDGRIGHQPRRQQLGSGDGHIGIR